LPFLIYISISFFSLKNNIVYCDASEPWQLYFQEPATNFMEQIIDFHDHLMFFITGIAVFVCWLLYKCITDYNEDKNQTPELFTHSTNLEIVWTILPAIILVIIAVPSFALLQATEAKVMPNITLKVVGHQWYWSYEYSDYTVDNIESEEQTDISYDSYMIPETKLTIGSLRLLEVTKRVVLPVKVNIRILVTAADVLHSWAVPSFGIKVDACPGRLNQTHLNVNRPGVYYGQCSEICGVNHGFMPIVVRVVKYSNYLTWICKKHKANIKYDTNNSIFI
jgi:cytochrome c oxidase subunit 2